VPLLEVKELHTEFRTGAGLVRAVGESGSGKSVGALSILRLIADPPGRITGGEILFDGRDPRALSEAEMREVRGRDIGMVFREPMTSLNPALTFGRRITEVLEQHQDADRAAAHKRALELLEMVGIEFAFLIGGLVVTERVLNPNGISPFGDALRDAIDPKLRDRWLRRPPEALSWRPGSAA
jgi:ABC-type glutathione transport system ATPase component